MEQIDIGGTEKNLKKLIAELEEEGIPVRQDWDKVTFLCAWSDTSYDPAEVVAYCHKKEDIKLNANLPTHRKHFIKEAKQKLKPQEDGN